MEVRGKRYPAPAIDVYYEPRTCIHAAECVRGLPNVFNKDARPWIQPEHASPDDLARVIERCPTGALHYVRKDGGAPEAVPATDTISLVFGGPLYVRGDVTLQLPVDTVVRKDTRMALCRCGHSQNKPFCDNSHLAAHFEA
jgi:uncharacterized Fe-S cluster protein YjdI